MSILTYTPGGALLKRYIDMNNIKDAFMYPLAPKRWEVLVGNSADQSGFFHEIYPTKKAALEVCELINKQIQSVADPK